MSPLAASHANFLNNNLNLHTILTHDLAIGHLITHLNRTLPPTPLPPTA
jgi:hypothetical protein